MGHVAYYGTTECGKTTLARHFAREFDKRGQKVIVFDPCGTPTAGGGWPERAVKFFDDHPDKFLEYLARPDVYQAHVFCDEAGDYFDLAGRDNHWLLRRGRHKGFFMHVIAQRPKMIAPNCRNQCSTAYVFRLAQDDANEIGKDYGHSNLGDMTSTLDAGSYILLQSNSPVIKTGNIFNQLKGSKK